MPAAAAGTRQEHALRTLRKAVQLHSARRAGASAQAGGSNVSGVTNLSTGRYLALGGIASAGMPTATSTTGPAVDVPAGGATAAQSLGLRDGRASFGGAAVTTWGNTGAGRNGGIAGISSGGCGSQGSQQPAMSQQFLCSQPERQSQPTADTTLPAHDLLSSQQKKVGLSSDQWTATLSTQTPSNLGPSDNNIEFSQSASQCLSQQVPSSQTGCLSQPLWTQPPSAPAAAPLPPSVGAGSQGHSQSVLSHQITKVGAPPPEAAAGNSGSSDVAAAAAALAAALAGFAAPPSVSQPTSSAIAAAGLPGRSEERRRGEEYHNDHSRLLHGSSAKPARRRLRGKGPHRLPTPSPPRHRHNEPEISPKRRRRQPSQRDSPASSAASSGTSHAHGTRRPQLRGTAQHALQRQADDEPSLLDRVLMAASASALTSLERQLEHSNQDHTNQLHSVRQDADELLTLMSEYRKECADQDALIAEISTIVEESIEAVTEKNRRRASQGGTAQPAALGWFMGKQLAQRSAITDAALFGGGSDSLVSASGTNAARADSLGLGGNNANPRRRRLIDGVAPPTKRRTLAA